MNINTSAGEKTIVTMKTNMGDIKIELLPEYAPKTVENFLGLAKKGYYDEIIFHRVIQDFMIQGGDPTGTGMAGESLWGKSFADECHANAINKKGALSMANSGPNTNGSQFFIVQADHCDNRMLAQMEKSKVPSEIIEEYSKNGGTPWLDGKHTVFGQVIEGMDIVDKIAAVEVGAGDKPVEDVMIESIEL